MPGPLSPGVSLLHCDSQAEAESGVAALVHQIDAPAGESSSSRITDREAVKSECRGRRGRHAHRMIFRLLCRPLPVSSSCDPRVSFRAFSSANRSPSPSANGDALHLQCASAPQARRTSASKERVRVWSRAVMLAEAETANGSGTDEGVQALFLFQ